MMENWRAGHFEERATKKPIEKVGTGMGLWRRCE
jgi:hypothetical protein